MKVKDLFKLLELTLLQKHHLSFIVLYRPFFNKAKQYIFNFMLHSYSAVPFLSCFWQRVM